jgi:hypothetical protein
VSVTGAEGGVDSVWEQEKLEARKMLVNHAESLASSARRIPSVQWSGKGEALLPLPPLRTVRATFIAYRSSISKALLDGETRQPIPVLTSRYRSGSNPTFPFPGAPAG